MFTKITLLFYLTLQTLTAQDLMNPEEFFKALETYPENYTAGNVITRWIDGIGYRYYWATAGLTASDYAYTPSASSRTVYETLEHVYGLASMLAHTAQGKENIRPLPTQPSTAVALRQQTLALLYTAREAFSGKTAAALESMSVIINRNDKVMQFPLWHLFNGPGADALYHIGQVVSFRRANGNPIDPKVNVFMGKNNN